MKDCGRRAGFVLLPVVLLLALVAAATFTLNREVSLGVDALGRAGQARQAYDVAAAGLAHARWTADASACAAYALPATGFGAHSYTATFTPDSGSPVAIAATATLASGVTRTLARTGVAVYEAPNTVTLQGSPGAAQDTWLYEWKPAWNYGQDTVLYVSNRWADSLAHALLEFDLSSLPPSTEVRSATLELYQNSPASTGGVVAVRRVTAAWDEGTSSGGTGAPNWTERSPGTTWGSAGGDFGSTEEANATIAPGTNYWVNWDVTDLVRGWVDGSYVNHGLALVPTGPATDVTFDSSEAADPTRHPKLTVVYACECGGGPGATVTLQPGSSGRDSYIQNVQPSVNFGNFAKLRLRNDTQDHRTLVEFDLSDFSADTTVTSAVLELNVETATGAGDADLHRLTHDWTETGVSWLENDAPPQDFYFWPTPGGDFEVLPAASASFVDGGVGPLQWDVTALVADWVSGAQPNHGAILLASTATAVDFTASDGADPDRRPKLTIGYTCPCGVACYTPPAVPLYYHDAFTSQSCDPAVSYAGSEGTIDWSAQPWTEVGEATDPCNDAIALQLDNEINRLRIRESSGIERAADLSGFDRATLSFDYRRTSFSPNKDLVISVSDDGGLNWVEVGRIALEAVDTGYARSWFDITPYANASSVIRIAGDNLSGNAVLVDEVRIDQNPPPTIFTATADSYLRENNPDVNFDPVPINVRDPFRRGVVHFDTSSVPPGTPIGQAMLRLNIATNGLNSVAADIKVLDLTESWSAPEVTWNERSTGVPWGTPGGTFGGIVNNASVAVGQLGWIEIDVTPLVQQWIDDPASNHGVLLTSDQNRDIMFYATESGATVAPQLAVTLP